MSYEGYRQNWCPNGHYHEGSTYDTSTPGTCTVCGQKFVITIEVDDTNCDSLGRIEPVKKTPAKVKKDKAGFWWVRPATFVVPKKHEQSSVLVKEHGGTR
ncbi:MAG: hypothetical protein HYT27_02910 [Parcubacteria group bacterium]|nr:hypothetical protein [Parcubacteria group bacterium]